MESKGADRMSLNIQHKNSDISYYRDVRFLFVGAQLFTAYHQDTRKHKNSVIQINIHMEIGRDRSSTTRNLSVNEYSLETYNLK